MYVCKDSLQNAQFTCSQRGFKWNMVGSLQEENNKAFIYPVDIYFILLAIKHIWESSPSNLGNRSANFYAQAKAHVQHVFST